VRWFSGCIGVVFFLSNVLSPGNGLVIREEAIARLGR